MALHVIGFERLNVCLQHWLNKECRSRAITSESERDVADIVRAVDVASRRSLFRSNCLHRSLTLWWLLHQRGCFCELHIGVRKREGRLEAHAWVERENKVLNDPEDTCRDYVTLSRSIVAGGARVR